jgi:SAM-dependent methyltransferase
VPSSRSAGFYATIARYYDSEHHDKDEDLPLYSEVADEAGGPILIVGSGTGRLALHLAAQGHHVHGIEIESAMLDRARQKRDAMPALAGSVTFHFADVLDPKLKIDEKFSLVIIPYNTFMHFLTLEQQAALLKRAKGWLSEGGLIVIDLPNAGEAYSSLDTEAVILERTFLEQETGHLVMQQSVSRLDRSEQNMEISWIYDEITGDGTVQRTIVPVTVHYFFLSEMTLLLRSAGFALETVYGDFDGSPFFDGCPRMIVLGRG